MNIVYMAKPIYGGWVTLTAHLSTKYNYPIYKITQKTEKNKRDFGYGCLYHNLCIADILQLSNIIISALDKSYWKYIHLFPLNTKLLIHDPTELKVNKKINNPLTQGDMLINKFNIITIRETVQEYISNNFNIQSELKLHPFYEYNKNDSLSMNNYVVSISRIDFDKNIDIILKANQSLSDKLQIKIFGAENRIYVHHKLKSLDFHKYWYGKYKKQFPMKYAKGGVEYDILKGCKYVIDLSTINNDGGGTQYTFLEAIYNGCILILNNEWINKGSTFVHGYNCYGVSNESDLINLLKHENEETNNTIKYNSKLLLYNHINVNW